MCAVSMHLCIGRSCRVDEKNGDPERVRNPRVCIIGITPALLLHMKLNPAVASAAVFGCVVSYRPCFADALCTHTRAVNTLVSQKLFDRTRAPLGQALIVLVGSD